MGQQYLSLALLTFMTEGKDSIVYRDFGHLCNNHIIDYSITCQVQRESFTESSQWQP